jgi:ornithine cyclodeaminase
VVDDSRAPVMLSLEAIRRVLDVPRLLEDVEHGFRDYSAGRTVVPPVGYLAFDPPSEGDVHIKYGYVRGGEYYVIKIVSGFSGNVARGLPPTQGMMLLFRQGTGELAAILFDDGYLTEIRTAVAGAIAARYLAPEPVTCIGIVGTGAQARFQLKMLRLVTPCRSAMAWGRSPARLADYCEEMKREGFAIEPARDAAHLATACNLIVTTTAAREPLLRLRDVRPGTHITAMGADAPGKQELDPELVARADIVAVDSLSQCVDHGEISHAVSAGWFDPQRAIELGRLADSPQLRRTAPEQITIADLTGVAVQDLQAAVHVFRRAVG